MVKLKLFGKFSHNKPAEGFPLYLLSDTFFESKSYLKSSEKTLLHMHIL